MSIKKHPIDDLFARKLGKNSIEPSAEAWTKLQSRLQPQKNETRIVPLPVWRVWAVAAGVSVVLMAGWLVFSPQNMVSNNPKFAASVNKKQQQNQAVAGQRFAGQSVAQQTLAPNVARQDVARQNQSIARTFESNREQQTHEIAAPANTQKHHAAASNKNLTENTGQTVPAHESPKYVAEAPKVRTEKAGEVTVILNIDDRETSAIADVGEPKPAETDEATPATQPVVIIKKRTKFMRFLAKVRDLSSDQADENALMARANPKMNDLESKIEDLKQFNFNRKQSNN